MPASEIQDVRRGKLLQGLFWGGVGLASLAILILLFGQGTGALRVAAIVSVFTIVMLAVSVALRPSVELVRIDIEERVLNEVDRVRARAREDVTTAARNTHRALSDKIHMLAETLDVLRTQMDELQASSAQGLPAAPIAGHHGSQPGGPGVVRRTETVHVTRRTTTVDAGDDDAPGTVYGSRAAVEGEWQERHDDQRRPDDWRADDRRGDDRRPDDRRGERAERSDRGDDGRASARSDDHGRELRVGERRSSVRRDDRGSELHVEDRWVALRRDDPRDRRRDDDGYGESDWEETFRSLSSKQNAVPALPPARGESPSRYLDDRDDHDRERARLRDRDGDRDTSRARDRDRGRDHERDRPYDRDRDDDRHRYRDDDRDRYRDHGRDRYRDDDLYRDDDRVRGHDRDDPPYAPRPRSAHPSEFDH